MFICLLFVGINSAENKLDLKIYEMDELCATCLSKHRALVPLSTIEVISSHLETIPFTRSLVLVCWECSSRLQNMRAFIAQATKAQELFKLYLESKKPLKTLRSLSRLSISSTKTEYDENFEYCMKQEPVEWEEEYLDDFESDVKYDTEVIEPTPKAETIDIQESYQPKSPYSIDNHLREASSEYVYVMVEPLTEPGDRDGNDSDEWPLAQVMKHKDGENECNIKTEPKSYENEKHDSKLSTDEDNIVIKTMSLKEMYRLRDEDRKNVKYKSCPFKCRSCITGYVTEKKYNAHLLMKHSKDIGPHACDICRTRHARADQLARHRLSHRHCYHCRQCQFNTHKLNLMLVHQSEHGPGEFSCQFCGLTAVTKERLRYHVNKMHKKPPRCETCLKDFASASSYKNHMRVKHGNGATREKCSICGGMFRKLAQHVRVQHAPPPAPDALCVECGVSFKNNATLTKHLSEHSSHRPQKDVKALKWFECAECGHRFMSKTCLKRHLVSQHTKQYPLSCDICHKGFLRQDKLKMHVFERHEGGERPRSHVCSHCGRGFTAKKTLTNHIRTHTGERPFQCAHCPWSFAQRVTLRTHMRWKHPGATGNTGGAGGSGNTDDGGNAESGKQP